MTFNNSKRLIVSNKKKSYREQPHKNRPIYI